MFDLNRDIHMIKLHHMRGFMAPLIAITCNVHCVLFIIKIHSMSILKL